jgi:hypothetical protein
MHTQPCWGPASVSIGLHMALTQGKVWQDLEVGTCSDREAENLLVCVRLVSVWEAAKGDSIAGE